MVPLNDLLLFAGAVLLLELTPGPNMIYLLSRAVCQGKQAALYSLAGVTAGFLTQILAAAIGLSTLFLAVPLAYEALRWGGAAYLLYLAWQAVKPGALSPLEARPLPADPPRKLVLMGFLTNLLNPKVAFFYLSIFPQFVSPAHGSVFVQSITLGLVQIFGSLCINLCIVRGAARLAAWFANNPRWLAAQRYVMGTVLAALALRLATEQRGNT